MTFLKKAVELIKNGAVSLLAAKTEQVAAQTAKWRLSTAAIARDTNFVGTIVKRTSMP